jgi:head-tail adaptor
MNIGNFDTMITIEQSTITKNSIGEAIKTWSTFVQLWGNVTIKSAGESIESKQKVGSTVLTFSTHNYAGITQEMRVYMLSEYWDIISVDYSDRAKMVLELKKKDNK